MRRAIRVLRRDGPGGLALAALRHTDLPAGDPDRTGADGPDSHRPVRGAVPGDAPGPRGHRRLPPLPAHYLSEGDRAPARFVDLCATSPGTPAGSSRPPGTSPGKPGIEDIDRRFALPPDTVYAYDAHTVSELRGRRVAPARASVAQAQLRDSGLDRGVAYVLGGYRSGERSRLMSGWRRFGVAGYLNLGLARIEFVRARRNPLQWRLRRRRSQAARAARAAIPRAGDLPDGLGRGRAIGCS